MVKQIHRKKNEEKKKKEKKWRKPEMLNTRLT